MTKKNNLLSVLSIIYCGSISRSFSTFSKSNDTLKCVIERTTAECGAGAAAYVQRYMDTSISPLKSFFACTDNRKFNYIRSFKILK